MSDDKTSEIFIVFLFRIYTANSGQTTPANWNVVYELNPFIYFAQGRGFWKTYWLIGKEGFNKPLPHAMTANSEPAVETLNIYYAS